MELSFRNQVKLKKHKQELLVKYASVEGEHPFNSTAKMLFEVGKGFSELGLPPAKLDEYFAAFAKLNHLDYDNSPEWKQHFVEGYWSDPYWHGISVAR